jgi:hypothetical protein
MAVSAGFTIVVFSRHVTIYTHTKAHTPYTLRPSRCQHYLRGSCIWRRIHTSLVAKQSLKPIRVSGPANSLVTSLTRPRNGCALCLYVELEQDATRTVAHTICTCALRISAGWVCVQVCAHFTICHHCYFTLVTIVTTTPFVGFEVLTAVVMKSSIFWNVTPCWNFSDVSEKQGQNIPPKHRSTFNWLYGVVSQKTELFIIYSVTWTPLAKVQLCKKVRVQQPLLGNSSVDILFPWQRENTQYWKRRFLCCRQLKVSVVRSEKLFVEIGDSSGTQRKGNVRSCKPLPSNG